MQKNNKPYHLSPKAVHDLEAIYLYSVKEFGIRKADSYLKELENGFQKIVDTPELSRHCDYVKDQLRAVTVSSHVIFFTIKKTKIVIIRILHKSMDFIKHF
jgi:toxin ParE1/3/4